MASSKLDRRQFLRASLVGLASLAFPLDVQAAGGYPAPVAEPALAASLQATFGSQYTVRHLLRQGGYWYARLVFQGLIIDLKSADGQAWYTADWQPPASV